MKIGVLALQGDYEAHAQVLERLGVQPVFVRRTGELSGVEGLILPGGESSTFLKFLEQGNFLDALRRLPQQGKPIFGTCAGAILLATEVTNPSQSSLGLIDMTVERNGYGRQLASAVKQGRRLDSGSAVEMVFIRAPRIRRVGPEARVLAECEGEPVLVEQGLCLAATFHPELSDEPGFHEYFLGKAGQANRQEEVQQV